MQSLYSICVENVSNILKTECISMLRLPEAIKFDLTTECLLRKSLNELLTYLVANLKRFVPAEEICSALGWTDVNEIELCANRIKKDNLRHGTYIPESHILLRYYGGDIESICVWKCMYKNLNDARKWALTEYEIDATKKKEKKTG